MPNFTKKVVIGAGQCGTRLASKFAIGSDRIITFNTDQRDSGGEDLENDIIVVSGGAGQNYTKGLKIWNEHREKIESTLENVYNQQVVYFISGGGGSGSSSVSTFLSALLKNKNKVLLVISLPFLKESIPATSNATRLLNKISEYSRDISIYLVSNDEISKEIDSNSFDDINDHIIKKTRMITDIIQLHDSEYFTPFAVDEGDHESVAFSGGFLNISFDNLYDEEDKIKRPKFNYGNIKEASNVLIVKNIPVGKTHSEAMRQGDKLAAAAMKLGNAARSARMIYGAIRSNKEIAEYTTIAAGIEIDKIFNKMREKATDSAIRYSEKTKEKGSRILERSEDKLLDI